MGTVQNISPEDLEVPLLRRIVNAGETVDADDALLDPSVYSWAHERWLVNGAPQAAQPSETPPAETPAPDSTTAAPAATQE